MYIMSIRQKNLQFNNDLLAFEKLVLNQGLGKVLIVQVKKWCLLMLLHHSSRGMVHGYCCVLQIYQLKKRCLEGCLPYII